ncbi:hypothetical protein PHMEG_00026831 [Phytophthora megakarya]|uniref:Endonuclease/exonuclease/phosphatase domain-containing protein n=1 Tax=Phytophthora megakarya TaxID=4795 RepID=A0A225VA31_9STRA|nr:hypothetical protein PHMEG_00026831 [Phytophthora megakarya]
MASRRTQAADIFDAELATTHNKLQRWDVTFVLGDFNAKLGQPRDGKQFVGNWARGYRNRNGHLLADFCELHGLTATNTFFSRMPRILQRENNGVSVTASTIKSATSSVQRPCSNFAQIPTPGVAHSRTPTPGSFATSRDACNEETRLACSRLYYDEDTLTDYQRRLTAALQDDAENRSAASPQDHWDRILRHAYTSVEGSAGYLPAGNKGRMADLL